MKLWAGHFQKETDSRVDDFNSSISFDARMYKQDIEGSMAHAAMLKKCGIIAPEEGDQMIAALGDILSGVESGALAIDPTAEDIHTFVEGELTARIGEAGKKLHTARSRNDQVATDLRLYLKVEVKAIAALCKELISTLCDHAEENLETIMPGYTHMQRAQPITFAHHLMAYAEMLHRDIDRLDSARDRMDECPLGSCALAGTTYPIDREFTARELGFARVAQNSLDGVSDRDYCVDIASACSLLMMHLSRFSEEIILWSSWEFRFVQLDDAFATGSSIMPQKINPDVAELLRGKTGRVYGDLTAMLTMLKGLPLAYNKDMQEDKEAMFDVVDTVKLCLTTFIPMVATMKVLPKNMREAAAGGFSNATDCADYLVRKGMAFRDAYRATGMLITRCINEGYTLETLPLKEFREQSELFDSDIYGAIALENCVRGRKSAGGPAPESVMAAIEHMRAEVARES